MNILEQYNTHIKLCDYMNTPYGEEYNHIYDFWTDLWNNLHIENINIYGEERIVFHKDNKVYM